jgi:signal transduction histidine kinase
MKVGKRIAINFFAVITLILAFTTAAILLLQYGKNIDKKITNYYIPVISAVNDYQNLIEESGRISLDLSNKPNPSKQFRLQKIHSSDYDHQKLTLIGLCQEPELEDIKNRIVGVDRSLETVMNAQKELLSLLDTIDVYLDLVKMQQVQQTREIIETEIGKQILILNETSKLATGIFNELEAKKNAIYRNLSYLLVSMIVAIAFLGLLFFYISNITVIKPIKELSAILDKVGEGRIISFQSQITRTDEIGEMINSAQNVVQGFKAKEQVANAIGKGDYDIKIPMLSGKDRLGKALTDMRDNLKLAKNKDQDNIKSLEAYTNRLEKENKELDQFANINSQVIKSPLHDINNLTEWIKEDMEGLLTIDSAKHFTMLKGSVHRMEAIINSLLKYAKAGKTKENQSKISSKQAVYEVLENAEMPDNIAILVDESLPIVTANHKDLSEVFHVFISNAINHNTNKKPVLNITYKEVGSKIEFCIADNGPGIASENHEKIFTIFRILENRNNIENTGAGLAIGKKIIEGYGGRIWIESSQGKGSKFYFNWPT